MLRDYILKLIVISNSIETLSALSSRPADDPSILELHDLFYDTLGQALSLADQNKDQLSEEDANIIHSLLNQHKQIGVALGRSI